MRQKVLGLSPQWLHLCRASICHLLSHWWSSRIAVLRVLIQCPLGSARSAVPNDAISVSGEKSIVYLRLGAVFLQYPLGLGPHFLLCKSGCLPRAAVRLESVRGEGAECSPCVQNAVEVPAARIGALCRTVSEGEVQE